VILATYSAASDGAGVAAVNREAGYLVDLQGAAIALLGGWVPEFTDMLSLIEAGSAGLSRAEALYRRSNPTDGWCHSLGSVRLLAPVTNPPQMRDFSSFERHMRQAGAAMARLRARRIGASGPLPTPEQMHPPEVFYRHPIYYKTNRFNVVAPDHEVEWPTYANLLDYELEFGVFLARAGRDIPRGKARDYIFGYTIFNDFSARDTQEYEMSAPFGPAKGKDFDTGNVLGPWIVTADEIADPYQLSMVARVNGEEWSRGTSADMVHRFEDMIAYVSRDETLHPGEFLGSGTVGNGCGLEVDRWLKPGDVVELEVQHIGVLRNRVVRLAGR
jgi:2-keto-4-pentenoate hydratase/2-oxohepta-3-ene-1,7-dioic acid hydratase in catechol pathway